MFEDAAYFHRLPAEVATVQTHPPRLVAQLNQCHGNRTEVQQPTTVEVETDRQTYYESQPHTKNSDMQWCSQTFKEMAEHYRDRYYDEQAKKV